MPPGGAQLRPRTRWSGCFSTLAQKRLGINQSQSSGNLRQISKNPKLVLKNLTQSLRHKRQSWKKKNLCWSYVKVQDSIICTCLPRVAPDLKENNSQYQNMFFFYSWFSSATGGKNTKKKPNKSNACRLTVVIRTHEIKWQLTVRAALSCQADAAAADTVSVCVSVCVFTSLLTY